MSPRTRTLRCLLTLAVAGIAACGHDSSGTGIDLSRPAVVAVAPDTLSLLVNDTARLRAVVLNARGDTLANAPVSFVSLDMVIATVDSTGLVRGRAGGAIYVRIESGDAVVTVLVRVRVNGTLVVSPRITFIQSTDTVQLAVVVRDSTGAFLHPTVQFHSADTSVARVSAEGRVVFGGSAGSVIILVSSEGRADGAFVTAVVARVATAGPGIGMNTAGEVLVGGGSLFGHVLSTLRPPATQSFHDVPVVDAGIIGDIALNSTATRAYAADPYFGNSIVVDLVGDSVLAVVPASTPSYSPWGPFALTVAPGDSLLYYDADGYVWRVRLATMERTPLFEFGSASRIILRDTLLYAVSGGNKNVQEFNLLRGTPGRQLGGSGFQYDAALTADGRRLYLLSSGGYPSPHIVAWDLVTGDALAPIDLPQLPAAYPRGAIAIQPTTGYLWVSTGSTGRVAVIDPSTWSIVRVLQPGEQPARLVFLPSGLGVLGNAGDILGNGGAWVDFVR